MELSFDAKYNIAYIKLREKHEQVQTTVFPYRLTAGFQYNLLLP